MEQSQFAILSGKDVIPLIPAVVLAADSHKTELGFYAGSTYLEFAKKDNVYVAVELDKNDGPCYAGHLIFNLTYPRAKIIQMFVLPKFRSIKIATQLLERLYEELSLYGFISIYARVATDLSANVFWEKNGFYVQSVVQGGKTKNRKINVRCKELDSPQLFPTSGFISENPLGLSHSANEIPIFLLDLNVLFDLTGPRRGRHESAVNLFVAERTNSCRLAISDEIRRELERTSRDVKTDPMLVFCSTFSFFPVVDERESNGLFLDLAAIVFSGKELLSPNDSSDLKHVATAIFHKLAGLITNDEAILSAAKEIKLKYGVEVISPRIFEVDYIDNQEKTYESTSELELKLKKISSDDFTNISSLLSKLGVTRYEMTSDWALNSVESVGVWEKNRLVGYTALSYQPVGQVVVVCVAVDESAVGALEATRILFSYLMDGLSRKEPRRIVLKYPKHQAIVKEMAFSIGFSALGSSAELSKISLGSILMSDNWSFVQSLLSEKYFLKLPKIAPNYKSIEQSFEVFTPDGNKRFLMLEQLESLLAPALFCIPGRPAVIVPVMKKYVEGLFGLSHQLSLLPSNSLTVYREKHYISGPNTLRYLKKGTIMLFYESSRDKGSSSVIGVTRVCQSYHCSVEALNSKDFDKSILDESSVLDIGKSKLKTVTVFDNFFAFDNPVDLGFLKKIGCGRPNDLITTKPVSYGQFHEILRKAFNYEN